MKVRRCDTLHSGLQVTCISILDYRPCQFLVTEIVCHSGGEVVSLEQGMSPCSVCVLKVIGPTIRPHVFFGVQTQNKTCWIYEGTAVEYVERMLVCCGLFLGWTKRSINIATHGAFRQKHARTHTPNLPNGYAPAPELTHTCCDLLRSTPKLSFLREYCSKVRSRARRHRSALLKSVHRSVVQINSTSKAIQLLAVTNCWECIGACSWTLFLIPCVLIGDSVEHSDAFQRCWVS